MSIRFPPISALRALEAAARLGSYARAAEELHVTQSAISHQIKHAEEVWDIKLFTQDGRKRVLTEPGASIVPIVRDFIQRLSSTVEDIKEDHKARALRVSLLQSFAMKWLVPRLGHFSKSNPQVEIWLSTSVDLADLEHDDVDIAIRLGHGNWPNTYTEKLLSEDVFPVCSPSFIEQNGTPKTPTELLNYSLFRRGNRSITPRWRDWFAHADVKIEAFPGGITFADSSLAIQAALDGLGIALARSAHVLDDVQAGRLIHLFPEITYHSDLSYYFVCKNGKENEPQVVLFKDWLVQEAKLSQAQFDANAI
ncbi:MAG: LysR family glycine cleavage system transcriptional activator [Saprospiraceae bacterium]|jgi:LysR family glycine cleavage system transcriptional activator